jgi:hypothetical protein
MTGTFHIFTEFEIFLPDGSRIAFYFDIEQTQGATGHNRQLDLLNLVFLRSVLRLLVRANVAPRSPIFVTLMMEALRSSETAFFTDVLAIGPSRVY